MSQAKYITAAASAYFLWGFFSFGSRPVSDYAALDILCYRLVLCTGLLWTITLLFRRKKFSSDLRLLQSRDSRVKRQLVVKMLAASVLLLINWLSFIYVMNNIGVQTAALSYMICPVIAALLGFLVLKEPLDTPRRVALLISITAVSLLAYGHFRELYFSLLVAVSFAAYLILQRKLNMFDGFNLLTVQATVITLLLSPFLLRAEHQLIRDARFYEYVMIIVVFFTIIPMLLNNYALKGINASTAGILLYINPVVNFLLAVLYYSEVVSWVQLVSYTMVVFSVIIYNSGIFIKKPSINC